MNTGEKVGVPGTNESTPSKKHEGSNSVFKQWEEKLGIKRTDPNFRKFVENAMANESEEDVRSTLMVMGFIPLPPRARIPLDPKIVPDWLEREN